MEARHLVMAPNRDSPQPRVGVEVILVTLKPEIITSAWHECFQELISAARDGRTTFTRGYQLRLPLSRYVRADWTKTRTHTVSVS